MRKDVAILTTLLLLCCCRVSAADVLQGQINHAESLPPVPTKLRAGCQFDDHLLPQMATKSVWFRIPKWLAGTWKRTESTSQTSGVPVTKKDVRIRRFGFQTDSAGRIWHWVRTPFPGSTQQKSQHAYFLIQSEEPISITRDQVVIHITWTVWSFSNSGVILNVYQGAQTDTFRQSEEGVIDASTTISYYDQEGKRKGGKIATWKDYLIEPYRPVDYWEGVDVASLFADFLRQNGLANQAPNNVEARGAQQRSQRKSDWMEE